MSDTQHYRGELAIPSQPERHGVTAVIDSENTSITLRFDEPVFGSAEWSGDNVIMMDRPKYREIQFSTTDMPKETVELTWKMNVSKLDNTIAGVCVVRPNTLRVRGETGFILTRV